MSNENGWRLIYYRNLRGDSPVRDFIDDLNVQIQRKVVETMRLLRMSGTNLHYPHVKKLVGTEIWELRILGSNNLRFFYVILPRQTFLLLHAFSKKKQKTDQHEIRTANRRLKDFLGW